MHSPSSPQRPWQQVLRGETLATLDASLAAVEPRLLAVGFLPTHLPAAVPQSLVETVGAHLRPECSPTRLSTRGSDRRRGWLTVSGLCLQALPFLAAQRLGERDLPYGVYFAGQSAHALEGWSRDAMIDMVAVHGLIAGLDESGYQVVCDLVDSCAAGLDHRATAESPLLEGADGRILRSSAGVLAHVVMLPPALVSAANVSCTGLDGRARRPVLTSVYLSQQLLAAMPAEPPGNGA